MRIQIEKKKGVDIQKGMIGLFFEDINYAADGGLYAEMIENRSFEFLRARGDAKDYYVEYDGGYGWSAYPDSEKADLKFVTGSPLSEENPHYMRAHIKEEGAGFSNQAYDGMYVEKEKTYKITFFARMVCYKGSFRILIQKDGVIGAEGIISSEEGMEETYNYFRKYELKIKAKKTVKAATCCLLFTEPGIVEFDYISMFPCDAVAGIFRRDLFDKLKELHPGFIRFPGGCIVEGNTLSNRYRYKDTLKEPWKRKNNWNRWAVHGNNAENHYLSQYAHYNQTLGLGYYEYFLLCEMLGAQPLPVLNVGFACQYQSTEMVGITSAPFQELLQDALDLIEFANGDVTTEWGAVRKAMGHERPFGMSMMGIGNEQWQTEKADFFERYAIFEQTIHACAPDIKLIGSAGPDITSERYKKAWEFYRGQKEKKNFVYAVDEHYYVKPQWLYEHVDFYDEYSREVKVFSGEYAAHPVSGMNMPEANTLEGALAEAAFLTGVERNADVVVLASYAPLFARIGYAQWSPDMIWFDGAHSYATPSYYVQKMFAENMGDITLLTHGREKKAAAEHIYYSLSYDQKEDKIILKIVNANEKEYELEFEFSEGWGNRGTHFTVTILKGEKKEDFNSIENAKITPYKEQGMIEKGFKMPGNSFAVVIV